MIKKSSPPYSLMEITIQSFAMIREIMGDSRVNIKVDQKPTVQNIIDQFIQNYPEVEEELLENGKISRQLLLAHNGEKIEIGNYEDHMLSDGDILQIIPPTGGG